MAKTSTSNGPAPVGVDGDGEPDLDVGPRLDDGGGCDGLPLDARDCLELEELEEEFAENREEAHELFGPSDSEVQECPGSGSGAGAEPSLEIGDPAHAVEQLFGDLRDVADTVGLGPDADPAHHGDDGPPDNGGDAAPPEPVVAPPPPPWTLLPPPTASGYVYRDSRSIMRIQRLADIGRLWCNCYLHPSGRINVPLETAPTDAELYIWLFSVPATPAGFDPPFRHAAAHRHMDLARQQWGARARK